MTEEKRNLCDNCENAVRWTETIDDYHKNKNARCSQTGHIIGLYRVVKCSHYKPSKTGKSR
jgi:hypothetical protein